ncbi:MAG: hypothetical protein IPL78_34445 [Chloroflexi bacterium]|nr:hypothetical protein [Chloroflexota bacterium]
MKSFKLSLPYFYQMAHHDQTAILEQMVSLFAGPLQHCRLFSLSVPASLERLERERRRLAVSREDEGQRRGLMEEVRMINQWASRGEMRHITHYLVDFADTLTPSDLGHWRIEASEAIPRLPVLGDYAEQVDQMVPVLPDKGQWREDHSRYRYATLASYQLTRTWDWRQPLAQLLTTADGPLVVCVDIRRVHPERVATSADFWEGMVLNNQDSNAHLAHEEAQLALAARMEAVHHVRVLLMVLDKTAARLKERVESLRKTSTQYMKLDRLLGFQAAAAQMFTPNPRPEGLPAGHFNTLSRGPAIFAGMWGTGRQQKTEGFYMGLSVDETAPHVSYLDWQGNDPFHGVILGKTGKGKTVMAQSLAWRLAEQDVQAIFLEPQGHSKRLYNLALAQGQSVSYNEISYEKTRLNILDVVHADPTSQYDHVITLLSLLLDPVGHQARRFTNHEVAAIRQALSLTYASYDWDEELLRSSHLTPTLDIFCHKLWQVADEKSSTRGGKQMSYAAANLAEEIESLYVAGDYAGVFNVPTNIDLSLKENIVLFNFKDVPERRRPLFYYAILAGINRQIRHYPRKRAVFVDEVHYLNQEGSLMGFLAHMVKTVRTYGAAIIAIDQDVEAFIGVEGAMTEAHQAGIFILNNLAWLVTFGKNRDQALRLQRIFPSEFRDAHVEYVALAGSDDKHGKGLAVILNGGRADMIYCQLRPLEQRYLFGS